MKKLLCILMSVLLAFSLTAVSVNAVSEEAVSNEAELPLIYLPGRDNVTFFKADGTPVKNPKAIDRGNYIKEHAEPVIKELAAAMVTGDYTSYVQSIVDACKPLYEEQICTPDGNIQEGQYINWDYRTAPIVKQNTFGIPAYNFFYDWRVSPLEIADELDHYIERVLAETGKEKINISARCIGANFMMAYIAKSYRGDYDHPFRVQNIIHNTSAVDGYIAFGALLSGSIDLSADAIDRFVTYFLEDGSLIDDPATIMFAISLVSLMNQAEALDLGANIVEAVYANVANSLIPELARCSTYGRVPAYWSMVGDKYFEKAVDYVFNTKELKTEYAGFIEKIEEYHALIGAVNPATGNKMYEDLLLELDSQSINSCVLAKYGQVSFPLFEGCEITGDSRATVTELSFGAMATDVGSRFDNRYLEKAERLGIDKYISPCKTVDASTCLFPDSTWFTTNLEHGTFPQQQNELMQQFFAANGELTVWDEGVLDQYTEFSTGTLLPVQKEAQTESLWTDDILTLIKRFFTSLGELIMKFFSGLFQK